MSIDLMTYRALTVPDPSDVRLREAVRGDVFQELDRGFMGLLMSIADFQEPDTALALGWLHTPLNDPASRQKRTSLYSTIRAAKPLVGRTLSLALEQGAVSRLYELAPGASMEVPWERFHAACDILRTQQRIQPLYSSEENYRIPSVLYLGGVFVSDETNMNSAVDGVLDRVNEHVLIHICVESTNDPKDLAAITRYAARLQDIVRPWNDDFALGGEVDYFGAGSRNAISLDRQPALPRKKDPIAETLSRSVQELREALYHPHLLFHFRVLAETPEVAKLVATALAQSAFQDGAYVLELTTQTAPLFDNLLAGIKEGRVTQSRSLGAQLEEEDPVLYADFGRQAHIARPQELRGAFRWPVGSAVPPCGIRQSTDPPEMPPEEMIVFGHDRPHGRGPCMPSVCGTPRGLLKRNGRKGIAILGMPGSGKTVALMNHALELYANGIPFIFFAPINGEQSVIKRYVDHEDPVIRGLARDLQVLTPGRNVSPVQFNPFAWSGDLDEHIGGLFECFQGAMPFFAALEGVLHDALYLVYRQYPDPAKPPIMQDLLLAVRQIIAEKGYQGELLGNLQAAAENRIGRLCTGAIGDIFNVDAANPSIEQLTSGYYLIELDALNEEQQALYIQFLLKVLHEHVAHPAPLDRFLRLAILIDEAHCVAGADTNAVQSEDHANPKAWASHRVCRLLKEFRKYRVCLVLADQTPSAVAADVLRMTGTKLVFRVVHQADRESVGAAMLFSEYEYEEIARLLPGEAFLFTEGYYKPRLIHTVDLTKKLDFDAFPDHQELHDLICDQPWYLAMRTIFETFRLERLIREMDTFETKRAELLEATSRLCAQFVTAKMDKGKLAAHRSAVRKLKSQLEAVFRDFRYGPYSRLIGHDEPGDMEALRTTRAELTHHLDNVIVPHIQVHLTTLDNQLEDKSKAQKGELQHAQ